MKKLMTIMAAVLLVTSFASCKKDYTCECSVDGSNIVIPLNGYKKKDATSSCDAAETTYKNGDPNASCTLK